MEYAARLPSTPTRRTMLAPVLALVIGAGAATGVYALVDNNDAVSPAAKVIVVESPAPGSSDIAGKNESATAAAIAGGGAAVTEIPGKDEAATAAGISKSGGVELRGSKASATGGSQLESPRDADAAQRTDPHGPASALHSR